MSILRALVLVLSYSVIHVNSERCYPHGAFKTDTQDCHKFYRCNWGFVQHLTCPARTAFNPRVMVCDYEWRVPECRSRTCSPSTRDPNEPCPARPPVIHKDPSCVQIQTKLLSTRSLSDIVPDVRCRSKFDIYPNPGHNSSYILCLDYQAVIKHCPPHLIFDSQKNRCDWPFLSI